MNIFHFCSLVLTKVHLNLKSEASKSYLSYLWWILEPALFVGVFYVVFGVFMASSSENFVVFLVCGKIPFLWLSRTVNNSANSILDGRGLMNQIKIQKIFFPLVVIIQDAVKSVVVFLIMLVFIWSMGIEPKLTWLTLPLIMLVQLTLITAISLVGAAIVPFVPDIRFIISTITMMLMFASGIFYDYKEVILAEHQELFLLNPLANLISIYRDILIHGVWPSWYQLSLIFAISCSVILLLFKFFAVHGGKYPRLVLQ